MSPRLSKAVQYVLIGGMLVAALALMALKVVLPTDERSIDAIIVHCTATTLGREVTVDDIDRWHKARGWKASAITMWSTWKGRCMRVVPSTRRAHTVWVTMPTA